MEVWKIIKATIPTICILTSFCHPKHSLTTRFRESFASQDLLLDLYFETNPNGYFQRGTPKKIKFTGFLVRDDRQEMVQGHRIDGNEERIYLFDFSQGFFKGRLVSQTSQCEPALHYHISQRNAAPAQGAMKAAFCAKPPHSL